MSGSVLIYPAPDGWVIIDDNDAVLAGPFVTVTGALHEAEAQGLVIENMDDVEKWQRPDDDWGIEEHHHG